MLLWSDMFAEWLGQNKPEAKSVGDECASFSMYLYDDSASPVDLVDPDEAYKVMGRTYKLQTEMMKMMVYWSMNFLFNV